MKRRLLLLCSGHPDNGPPSIEQCLREAEELALLGYYRAACVAARCALELSLKAVCAAANVWPRESVQDKLTAEVRLKRKPHPIIESFLMVLKDSGKLEEATVASMRSVIAAANRAAHARGAAKLHHVLRLVAWTHEMMELAAGGFPDDGNTT